MRKTRFHQALYACIGIASIALNFLFSGAVIALVHVLRFWAYPVMFFTGFGLIAFVLVVLIPPARKHDLSVVSPWKRRFGRHEERLARGFWAKARSKGPFLLLLAVTVILGPFVGAITSRFLGLSERATWTYLAAANAASTAFWVSAYLGLVEWVGTAFMSVIT